MSKELRELKLEAQLKLLLQLIYETPHCDVKIKDLQIFFRTKNNGRIGRGKDGAHAAAMPALAFALGDTSFKGKRTLDTGYIMPDEFVVQALLMEKVRDQILKYEVERFLISRQNHCHFLAHKTPHPLSGKGATDAENLCRDAVDLGLNFEVSVQHDKDGRFVKITIANAEALADFKKHFPAIPFKAGETYVVFTQEGLIGLLQSMLEKKINYQGVIPLDENGAVFLALRKNPGQPHSLGYATCGGHCGDPYHAQLVAAIDLKHEFGLSLKDPANISALQMINKTGDVAVFMVEATNFEAQKFSPIEREFVKGSGDILSFKEMRDRKLPLRNIPSLDLYLKFCEEKLQDFAKAIAVKKISVPVNCRVANGGVVQFPENNFGAIEFYGDDLGVLATSLKEKFGGEIIIDQERGCAIINDVNPAQVIALFEGKKIKEDLEKYRRDQSQKAKEWDAAIIIQNEFRQMLARKDLEEKTGIGIKKSSRRNFIDILYALQKADHSVGNDDIFGMTDLGDDGGKQYYMGDQPSEDLEHKDPSHVLSLQEQVLFKTFCRIPLFLYHATNQEAALAIENNDYIFSSHGLKRQGGITPKGRLYESMGMGGNICFNIGSKDLAPHYFCSGGGKLGMQRNILFCMDFKSLLKESREFARGAWIGETLIRFYRPDSMESSVRIGDTIFRNLYLVEKAKGGNQSYFRSDGTESNLFTKVGSKICTAENLVEFLGYQLIENLRLIDGSARKYLLENPGDEKAIVLVADKIFSNIGIVCYVPSKLCISNPSAKMERLELESLKKISAAAARAINLDDTNVLDGLKAKHPNLAQYLKLVLADKDNGLGKNPEIFFIIRAIHFGASKSLEWLIKNDFFSDVMVDFNLSGSYSETMKEVLQAWQGVVKTNGEAGKKITDVFTEQGIFTQKLFEAFSNIFIKDPRPLPQLLGANGLAGVSGPESRK